MTKRASINDRADKFLYEVLVLHYDTPRTVNVFAGRDACEAGMKAIAFVNPPAGGHKLDANEEYLSVREVRRIAHVDVV